MYNISEEREIKNKVPWTIMQKRMKYLGINSIKEAKDLYNETIKLLKETRHQEMEKFPVFMGWNN